MMNRFEGDFLSRLSTEQLEEILRADLASPDHDDDAAILRVLSLIEERERAAPTGRLPDTELAWETFLTHYAIPEGEGQSLYPMPPQEPIRLDPPAPQKPPVGRKQLGPIAAALAAAVALFSHDE